MHIFDITQNPFLGWYFKQVLYSLYNFSKTKKRYNQSFCLMLEDKYMEINTYLIKLITLYRFLREKYFFIFIDRRTKKLKIKLSKKKRNDLAIYKHTMLKYRQYQ